MSNNKQSDNSPVIACDLNAIQTGQRAEHLTTAEEMLGAVLEVRDLHNGYALGLPNNSSMIYKVAGYIANERLCCPFFDFALSIQGGAELMWLELSGGDGVKEFLTAELGGHIRLPL